MQGGTRRKDSYIGHPLPFLWHEGSPRVTGYFPQYKKPRMDTNTKARSRQRNGDHAQGSRRRLVSPSPTRRKQRKRGGKRRSGRGGQRRKMRKADGCPRGTSEYAHGIVQVPTDEALSWRRWSTTLMWYVYKKQGHAQIHHWCFKASQSSRGMKAVVWQ